jgi:hypothetical protein
MSSADVEIQQTFEPWQAGLVVDPIERTFGFFVSDRDGVRGVPEICFVADRKTPPQFEFMKPGDPSPSVPSFSYAREQDSPEAASMSRRYLRRLTRLLSGKSEAGRDG